MQHPNLITNWTVKRSGAALTVTGVGDDGQAKVFTLVRSVTPSDRPGIAHAKDVTGAVVASLVT